MQGPDLKNKRIIFAGTADEVQGHVQAGKSFARLPSVFSVWLGTTSNSTPARPSPKPELRLTRRRQTTTTNPYSFLTFRKHGGWQEQEIVQGQEGPEEEDRPLR
jgi:hypothetical protein